MSNLKTDFKYTIFALFVNLAQWKLHAINIICIPFLKTAYNVVSFHSSFTYKTFKHNGSQL